MNFAEQVEKRYVQSLKSSSRTEKEFRKRAWAEYLKQGLPDRKNEAWRYTNLTEFNRSQWTIAESSEAIPVAAREMMIQWENTFDIAVIVNGQLIMKDSQLTLKSNYTLSQRSLQTELPLSFDDGLVSAAAAIYHGGFELRVGGRGSHA